MKNDTAFDTLLNKNNISKNNIFSILTDVCQKKIEYSDLYFQKKIEESWFLEDRIVKEGNFNIDQGIGLRLIKNNSTFFSYSDEISVCSLNSITKDIVSCLNNKNQKNILKPFIKCNNALFYENKNPIYSLTNEKKIEILYMIDKIARNFDPRVKSVTAYLSSSYENILIASTDSIFTTDTRPLTYLSINVRVEEKGKIETGSMGGGRRSNYNFFLKDEITSGDSVVDFWTKEAVRIALVKLSSKETPSGTFPVVLGPGWPGILLHEAVGHGLEGDFNRSRTSIFNNKIGKKIASNICTVVDDGTVSLRRGSINIDDEGTPGQYNILIENGVLKSFMHDKLNARLMGLKKSTGNARRQSYAHIPMPRMTNTYMLPNLNTNPDDIIKSVKYGIYAKNFSGGEVDITSGEFVFSTSEAYLIKNGKILYPVKKTMLMGSGIHVMNNISMIGNDLCLDSGVGICVKNGQSIPVGVGQPTVKVDSLTVGGTK
ncbi:metalloprotease TldD [Buchnera aphidicola (Kurisakia onigurumii)]|uniref:metalloprotease TldD n=1 Tax=Buchnera aphidicola TaxID=9 RepID=UPI0031B67EF7